MSKGVGLGLKKEKRKKKKERKRWITGGRGGPVKVNNQRNEPWGSIGAILAAHRVSSIRLSRVAMSTPPLISHFASSSC